MNPQLAQDLQDAFRCGEPVEYLIIGAAIGVAAAWLAYKLVSFYALPEVNVPGRRAGHIETGLRKALRTLHLL